MMNRLLAKTLSTSLFMLISCYVIAQKMISVDDIYKHRLFYEKSVKEFNSMNDGQHYTLLVNNNILKYSYTSGKCVDTLFYFTHSLSDTEKRVSGYTFSDDESTILLSTAKIRVYRHSFLTYYYVFDILENKLVLLSENKQQMAVLSPNGKAVAFVLDNDLYIKHIATGEVRQITHDGEHGKVINGMPDWVYEEEFALKKGLAWSDDGTKLAFYRFDESEVREYQMETFTGLYPDWYRFKYPKAGEKNSVVEINVFDMQSSKITRMNIGEETDIYIPRIKWTADSEWLSVIRLNRLQNNADILLCNASTGASERLYTEKNDKYITEFGDDFATFLSDNENVVIYSERSGFKHLYLYNIRGKLLNAITKGNWEVDKILAFDENKELIYYTSTEDSPLTRHIYCIMLNGKGKKKLTTEPGTYSATFSNSFDYYLQEYSSVETPKSYTLHNSTGKLIRVVEDNQQLKQRAVEYGFTGQQFFHFKGPSGDLLNGYMYYPKDFNPNKQYPLLMYVYGGPGSQEVINSWNPRQAWFQMLNQKGYIVACIDNRGTGGRGEAFKKCTYLNLGEKETKDQVAAAEYMASLDYIDANRIGIFGWSYGGYMSLLGLSRGSHIFKASISVAPVTNWRFYDNIYTERFMRTPQENAAGYDANSPISYADNIKGKLLLIHGSNDDNVHYQNTMMLIDKLIEEDVQFDLMIYPNRNHSINGGNTRVHLYTKMTNFILDNL